MLASIKFPSIADVNNRLNEISAGSGKQFFTEKEEHTNIVTENAADHYQKSMSGKQYVGNIQLLSTDISKEFQYWKLSGDTSNSKYYPNWSTITTGEDDKVFSTEFTDNWKDCIFDLHVDDNGNIVDGSINGQMLTIISGDAVTIVSDDVYGKVIQFNNPLTDDMQLTDISDINQLPVITVNDFNANTNKLQLTFDDPSKTYTAFVFCKVGENGDNRDVTFFERTNYAGIAEGKPTFDGSEKQSPYKFEVNFGAGSSAKGLDFSSYVNNSALNGGVSLTCNSYPTYDCKRLFNQWTLFSFTFSMNHYNGTTQQCKTKLNINATKSSFMDYENSEKKVFDGADVRFNPEDSSIFPENNPLYEAGATNKQYKIIPRVHEEIRTWNYPSGGYSNNTSFDNTKLFIGATSPNADSNFSWFENMQIKFIKIFQTDKWNADYNDALISKMYWDNCVEPYLLEKGTHYKWSADNLEEGTTSDNSISGKYLQVSNNEYSLTGFPEIELVVENNSALSVQEKSLTIIAWLSGDFLPSNDNSSKTILQSGNNVLKTIYDENLYASSLDTNNNVPLCSDWIGDLRNIPTYASGDDVNIDDWSMPQLNYRLRQISLVSHGWHCLAMSWNYPNIERDSFELDTSNIRRTFYLDGIPINKTSEKFLQIDNLLNIGDIETLTGTMLTSNNLMLGQNLNFKSIEVFYGDTIKGQYLTDQEVFALWQRDYEEYFPNTDKSFLMNMYVDPVKNDGNDWSMTDFINYSTFSGNNPFTQYISKNYDYLLLKNKIASADTNVEPTLQSFSPTTPLLETPDYYAGISNFDRSIDAVNDGKSADYSALMMFNGLKINFDEDMFATLVFVVDDGICLSVYGPNNDNFILSSETIDLTTFNEGNDGYSQPHKYVMVPGKSLMSNPSGTGYLAYYKSVICHRKFLQGEYVFRGFVANRLGNSYVYGGIYNPYFDPFEVINRRNPGGFQLSRFLFNIEHGYGKNATILDTVESGYNGQGLLSNFHVLSSGMTVNPPHVPDCLTVDNTLSNYTYDTMFSFFDGKHMDNTNSIWLDKYSGTDGLLDSFQTETQLYGTYNISSTIKPTLDFGHSISDIIPTSLDSNSYAFTENGLSLGANSSGYNYFGIKNFIPRYSVNEFTMEITLSPEAIVPVALNPQSPTNLETAIIFSCYDTNGIQINLLSSTNYLSADLVYNQTDDVMEIPGLSLDNLSSYVLHFTLRSKAYWSPNGLSGNFNVDVYSKSNNKWTSSFSKPLSIDNRNLPVQSLSSCALAWDPYSGGSSLIADTNHSRVTGVYHAIRMYYRYLSDEELEKNRNTDISRYINANRSIKKRRLPRRKSSKNTV